MTSDPKRRTTEEIALEMNATSHDIAQSVPAPARAVQLLKELRKTNDDLRVKLGRDRQHDADGTKSTLPPEPSVTPDEVQATLPPEQPSDQ
jgi:hypothetical protein